MLREGHGGSGRPGGSEELSLTGEVKGGCPRGLEKPKAVPGILVVELGRERSAGNLVIPKFEQ